MFETTVDIHFHFDVNWNRVKFSSKCSCLICSMFSPALITSSRQALSVAFVDLYDPVTLQAIPIKISSACFLLGTNSPNENPGKGSSSSESSTSCLAPDLF